MSSGPHPCPDLDGAYWIHQRAGVDYGPYTSEEVLDLIAEGEIDAQDSLIERATYALWRLEEIPRFREAWEQRQRRVAEQAIEAEVAQNVERIQQGRRLRPLLLTLVVVGVGAGTWFVQARLRPRLPSAEARALPRSILPDPDHRFALLERGRLPAKKPETTTTKVGRHEPQKRRPKARERRRPPAGTPTVMEFDFSDDEAIDDPAGDTGPPPLRTSELRRLMGELKAPVLRCVRLGSASLAPGAYRVLLRVEPSGTITAPRVSPAEGGAETLLPCLRHVAETHTVRAFTGVARTVALPFAVSVE